MDRRTQYNGEKIALACCVQDVFFLTRSIVVALVGHTIIRYLFFIFKQTTKKHKTTLYILAPMTNFSFHTGERLKSRKEIENLFSRGSQSIGQYPLRLVWRPAMERRSQFPVQITTTVSKRNFKRAVDRNRIKRVMREAYRLNKGELYKALPEQEEQLAWMIIYIGRELPVSRKIDKAMQKLIRKFLRQFPPTATNE